MVVIVYGSDWCCYGSYFINDNPFFIWSRGIRCLPYQFKYNCPMVPGGRNRQEHVSFICRSERGCSYSPINYCANCGQFWLAGSFFCQRYDRVAMGVDMLVMVSK